MINRKNKSINTIYISSRWYILRDIIEKKIEKKKNTTSN